MVKKKNVFQITEYCYCQALNNLKSVRLFKIPLHGKSPTKHFLLGQELVQPLKPA